MIQAYKVVVFPDPGGPAPAACLRWEITTECTFSFDSMPSLLSRHLLSRVRMRNVAFSPRRCGRGQAKSTVLFSTAAAKLLLEVCACRQVQIAQILKIVTTASPMPRFRGSPFSGSHRSENEWSFLRESARGTDGRAETNSLMHQRGPRSCDLGFGGLLSSNSDRRSTCPGSCR